MSRDISNSDDVIDSRDVIERIDELQADRDALSDKIQEAQDARDAFDPEDGGGDEAELDQFLGDAQRDLAAWDESADGQELKVLLALQDEAEGVDDWRYGATLVSDSYFVDYCRELLEDIGDLPKDLPHYIEIDWEATARNIRMDYTAVEFDGVTYWVR